MFDQLIHTMVPYDYLVRINYELDPKATWKIPAVLRALTVVQSWSEKGYFQDNFLSLSTTDADNLFINGDAAIDVTGSWNNSNFIENAKFPVRFFPTPQVNKRLPWHLGGFTPNNAWVLPSYVEAKDEALDYIDYVLDEDVARALWKTGDIVAYRFDKIPPASNVLQKDVYQAMQKTLVGLYGFGSKPEFLQAGVSIFQELASLRITPKQAQDKIEVAYRKVVR